MSRRQLAHRRRVQEFWRARAAAARTPRARAEVKWDHLRADIGHLPAKERDETWGKAADAIDGIHRELRTASTHPDRPPTPSRARARARLADARQEHQP